MLSQKESDPSSPDLDELFIGMPMKAVLKPKAKREGSILDIEGFKPVE